MTTPSTDPPPAHDELVATGSERDVLEAFLDFHRGVVVRRLRGVSEADARRRLVPSETTPGTSSRSGGRGRDRCGRVSGVDG